MAEMYEHAEKMAHWNKNEFVLNAEFTHHTAYISFVTRQHSSYVQYILKKMAHLNIIKFDYNVAFTHEAAYISFAYNSA
jgi:hypothetical protein